MRAPSIILAVLLVTIVAPPLGAADQPMYAPIDMQVRRVESGGEWRDAKRSGSYRAVIRSRFTGGLGYDDLFVEWVETSSRPPKVVARKRVKEVGGLTFVSDLRLTYSQFGSRLEIRHHTVARARDGGEEWEHCLTLGSPGKYTRKDGPCSEAG